MPETGSHSAPRRFPCAPPAVTQSLEFRDGDFALKSPLLRKSPAPGPAKFPMPIAIPISPSSLQHRVHDITEFTPVLNLPPQFLTALAGKLVVARPPIVL